MQIDCNTCPGRQIACDGCMMQVLFDPVNSADVTPTSEVGIVPTENVGDRDLLVAIDSFCAAAMISTADADLARNAIAPRQGIADRRHLRILRAS